MIIAREKKKTNIVEYLLYMWQIEDLIRAFDLDINNLDEQLVKKYDQPVSVRQEIKEWYANHIQMMIDENCRKEGHLVYLKNIADELEETHKRLLASETEKGYRAGFEAAKNDIESLKKRSGKSDHEISDVVTGLNGLYGYLLLKLQKKEINTETKESIGHISKWMSLLADFYRKLENGETEW